ncbi:hypothetical protein MED01_003103 [Micromonospora sp. MED01]|uniref:hypothetical protein n=1 Tax=Micromonospora alfalfae TaxID=2911212 RepID=UPI001EE8C215|nr:hypothetical protein [Micromonospora alfalfae]MCG5464846.1 hypothetical protein [Micromonospora alfalfae]
MTSVHRPLSTWVARLSASGEIGPINGGREQADARTLPWFGTEWTRARVPAIRIGQSPRAELALALIEDGTGAIVVELDNYGQGLPVSEAGLAAVADAERHWPDITSGPGWTVLTDEPLQLRYLLLKRLVAESGSAPPTDLFHILDWHLVQRLAEQLARATIGEAARGAPIVLRHWFSSAVRGLTAALEQLDAGQRAARADVQQQGIQNLLTALRRADVRRIPESPRSALATLLTAIADAEPIYAFAVRARRQALTDSAGDRDSLYIALEPHLAAAAAGNEREQQTDRFGEAGFSLAATRSARGLLTISAYLAAADVAVLPLFLAIRVELPQAPAEDRIYWVALRLEDDQLTGSVEVPLPGRTFVVSADDVPVGLAALRFTDPAILLRSIRVSEFETGNTWLEAAEELPASHAVRVAAVRFGEPE